MVSLSFRVNKWRRNEKDQGQQQDGQCIDDRLQQDRHDRRGGGSPLGLLSLLSSYFINSAVTLGLRGLQILRLLARHGRYPLRTARRRVRASLLPVANRARAPCPGP
mmetsp:Transcript_69914/g.166891  ORF Transcript_69914/g.166891 Transcript_69914/m.166891 type:complete len:107 (+) Transcript_69914:1313-1633(+)